MTYDSTGSDVYGAFRLILFDSTVEDYCVVNWVFDETTVAPDTDYADGYVTDGFYGADLEVWFGYVVLAQPQTQGSCDSLTTDWLTTLDQIKADRPGFGYTIDRRSYNLNGDRGLCSGRMCQIFTHWYTIDDCVLRRGTSLLPCQPSLCLFMDENGVTTYDPNSSDIPQGTEISLGELPGDGFYMSQYYYGISLGGH